MQASNRFMQAIVLGVIIALLSVLADLAAASTEPDRDSTVLPQPQLQPPASVKLIAHGKSPAIRDRSPKAPENAPNVVIVLLDDVGFGAAATFGGPVPTHTLTQLASSGLEYNNFHTTGGCSPTRAALQYQKCHSSA